MRSDIYEIYLKSLMPFGKTSKTLKKLHYNCLEHFLRILQISFFGVSLDHHFILNSLKTHRTIPIFLKNLKFPLVLFFPFTLGLEIVAWIFGPDPWILGNIWSGKTKRFENHKNSLASRGSSPGARCSGRILSYYICVNIPTRNSWNFWKFHFCFLLRISLNLLKYFLRSGGSPRYLDSFLYIAFFSIFPCKSSNFPIIGFPY